MQRRRKIKELWTKCECTACERCKKNLRHIATGIVCDSESVAVATVWQAMSLARNLCAPGSWCRSWSWRWCRGWRRVAGRWRSVAVGVWLIPDRNRRDPVPVRAAVLDNPVPDPVDRPHVAVRVNDDAAKGRSRDRRAYRGRVPQDCAGRSSLDDTPRGMF